MPQENNPESGITNGNNSPTSAATDMANYLDSVSPNPTDQATQVGTQGQGQPPSPTQTQSELADAIRKVPPTEWDSTYVPLPDGTEISISDLRQGALRHADYTRKQQAYGREKDAFAAEIAAKRQEVENYRQQVEEYHQRVQMADNERQTLSL